MTSQPSNLLPHQMRVSLFHRDTDTPSNFDISEFGVEPELIQDIPVKKEKFAVGSFGSGKLQIRRSSNRIDFIWDALVQDDMIMLGAVDEVFSTLLKPIEHYIRSHSWLRVALGVHAASQVDGHVAGYKVLQEKLPHLQLDGERCSDFVFQINRFQDLDLPSGVIRINRIAKWAVSRFDHAEFNADLVNGAVSTTALKSIFLAGVEADINSAPSPSRILAGDESIEILNFAAKQVDAIIQSGDQ